MARSSPHKQSTVNEVRDRNKNAPRCFTGAYHEFCHRLDEYHPVLLGIDITWNLYVGVISIREPPQDLGDEGEVGFPEVFHRNQPRESESPEAFCKRRGQRGGVQDVMMLISDWPLFRLIVATKTSPDSGTQGRR